MEHGFEKQTGSNPFDLLAENSGDCVSGMRQEIGRICRERAAQDPRIRYRKLEKNGGISGNTNVCLEMAEGPYIALFDHDDRLHPAALDVMTGVERAPGEKSGKMLHALLAEMDAAAR